MRVLLFFTLHLSLVTFLPALPPASQRTSPHPTPSEKIAAATAGNNAATTAPAASSPGVALPSPDAAPGTASATSAPASAAPENAAPQPGPPPDHGRARISVRGAGWWGNIQQVRTIDQILDAHRGPVLGADEIEDIAFLLISYFVDEGYLRPRLDIRVTTPDGLKSTHTCDENFDLDLPRDILATKVRFKITRGHRYHLKRLAFTGLDALPEADARALFFPTTAWVGFSPPYSVNTFSSSISSLQNELHQRGHAQSVIDDSDLRIDDSTGRVAASVKVTQGPVWKVDNITIDAPQTFIDTANLQKLAGLPWSQWWQQDLTEQARQLYFRHGYPDVRLRLEHTTAPSPENAATPSPENGRPQPGISDAATASTASATDAATTPATVPVSVTLHVEPGPQVHIGKISLSGNNHTRASAIRRRIRFREGDLLNPVFLENARYRI
ncbi:MAG: hypothetical protein LBM92_04050, partial [Opitutaceae bacterium]|nr:hypothetical protein [Opitutaceae bacterium]